MGKGSTGISEGVRAALAQAAKARGRPNPPNTTEPKRQGPTPEQRRHTRYELEPVTERGQVVAHAYKRQPWFEILANRGDISRSALKALRFYRNAYEGSFYSEMRCALDFSMTGGGGSRSIPISPAEVVTSKHNLALCEAGIGSPYLDTLRAIGLHDMRFADVAMERFGSRMVSYIEQGRHLEKPAPRSGRHREIVRNELETALSALIGNVGNMVRSEQ